MDTEIILLFEHTAQGTAALSALDQAGIPHDAIGVIGDLGAATSQPGAERHVTLDTLHIPAAERDIFMDTIRAGGVVLAVDATVVDAAFIETIAHQHAAMRLTQTSATAPNPSHNVAT